MSCLEEENENLADLLFILFINKKGSYILKMKTHFC